MRSFEYTAPTKIVFGKGEFSNIGKETAKYGKHALLVKQEGPLEEMGVYKKAAEKMEEEGIQVSVFQYISSNPKLSKIREGIAYAKEHQVDVVVAVGGGSAIDAAKAVALGAVYEGDVWDFWKREKLAHATLPVIAVSTISATGSETSCHAVVTNDEDPDTSKWQKWALHDAHVYPATAMIDPELLATVPRKLTAAGMADTISHVLEGYFDGVPDNPLSDRIGEGIIQTVIENERVLEHPEDLEARASISWAATLAMSGLQDCGRSNEGFPAHWIQHAVGALTDSSHGEGLAVINPAWLEHVNRQNPEKFVQFAQRVFKLERKEGMSDQEYGQAGIDALKERFRCWGLPVNLRQLGVTKELLPSIVKSILESPETYQFLEEDLYEVLNSCF